MRKPQKPSKQARNLRKQQEKHPPQQSKPLLNPRWEQPALRPQEAQSLSLPG